jgi:hypothetical protein
MFYLPVAVKDHVLSVNGSSSPCSTCAIHYEPMAVDVNVQLSKSYINGQRQRCVAELKKVFLTQKSYTKLSEIWSGMSNPDPGSQIPYGFFPSRISDSGSRGKKSTGSPISDPDQQNWPAGVKPRDIMPCSVNQSPCSVSLLLSKFCFILPVHSLFFQKTGQWPAGMLASYLPARTISCLSRGRPTSCRQSGSSKIV